MTLQGSQLRTRTVNARPILIALLALFSYGCATFPTEPVTWTSESVDAEDAAIGAYAEGDHDRAASLFAEQARAETDPARRADLFLLAAHSAASARKPRRSRRYLNAALESDLNEKQSYFRVVIESQIGLLEGRVLAGFELDPATPLKISDQVRAAAWAVNADSHAATGDAVSAVEARVERERLLKYSPQVSRNQEAIWRLLMDARLDSGLFQRLADADPVTRGWIELALLARSPSLGDDDRARQISEWRQRHDRHPATANLNALLETARDGKGAPPSRVALLLPLSGNLSAPAAAVRDGYLSGYYSVDGDAPLLRIYDTAGQPGTAIEAYENAIDDGAEIIIGPLTKEAVHGIALMGEPAVPMLALNYLEDGNPSPDGLVQFGLSPEDEARQVAQRAALDGLLRAIVLVPDGDLGRRSLEAFDAEIRKLGGEVLSVQTYRRDTRDFSGPMQSLLLLSESRARHRKLSATLGIQPEFEPRRRNDLDFIFLVARPEQGRQIRPQFKFHRAADVPIYATSRIYAGRPDPETDYDLNGLLFCDVPWLIDDDPRLVAERTRIEALWPKAHDRYARLFALGRDAQALTPLVRNELLEYGFYYPAMTGSLFLREPGAIGRALTWAKFHKGRPVPPDHEPES